MPRFERSITVNCPPQKAYDYLADVDHHPDWASHNLSVEKTSAGPIAVGSTFSSTGHQMGTHTGVVTITELVPNQKIVYESNDDTGQIRHSFTLAAENGGTRIAKSFETIKTGFMLTVFRPMMYVVQPRLLSTDLQKIKSRLEA
jgi:uncharacterized protein YndB with AHSA1/START domain